MAVPPVAFLTDIEGMWPRLAAFAEDNPHVSLEHGRLLVKPGSLFIFGGDAIDRGPAGRRVLQTLLEAKERQPDQVVLLAGNRDLNKLRLTRELHGHPPQKMPEEVRASDRASQLRWIFSHTMGAGEAFEHRRTELGAGASDDEVVESYIEDVGRDGPIRRYLRLAQLSHRVGGTLFVHGGVTDENLFRIPSGERARDVDAWVEGLNGWYQDQLAAVDEGRIDPEGKPVWTALMAYQAPLPGTRLNQQSVVYGRTADDHNNPMLPGADTRGRLLSEGVHRVVVGHTPNGDSPSVLRASDFELLIADTSHARVPEGTKLHLHERAFFVDGWTKLDDGTRRRVRFEVGLDDRSPIGSRIADTGELIKGRLESGEYVAFRYLPKYQFEQRAVAREELEKLRLIPPQ